MTNTEQTLTTMRAVFAALQTHDRGQFHALLTPDAVLHNPATGETLHGPDTITQTVWLVVEAFPDLYPEITTLFAQHDQGVAETIRHGTHTAPLHSSRGTIPPTGRTIHMPECILFQVREGKVARITVHTDRLTIMEQLGLLPPSQRRADT